MTGSALGFGAGPRSAYDWIRKVCGAAPTSAPEFVVSGRAGPALAVFRPRIAQRYVTVVEQDALAASLATRFSAQHEVRLFEAAEAASLAAWMDSYMDDGVRDVLVLVDLSPTLVFAGQSNGSRAEEWLEHGNALVWTGWPPFAESIAPDGTTAWIGGYVLDRVLDSGPQISSGTGSESLQPIAALLLPSLTKTVTVHSLRLDRIGAQWHTRRVFALGSLPDSDALELVHTSGGVYAQFYCLPDAGLPRAAVLGEYLELLLRPTVRTR